MTEGCICYCHLPGCRVYTVDGEPCCHDREDERPPIPRATPPPEGWVEPLSPTVQGGRKKAVIG